MTTQIVSLASAAGAGNGEWAEWRGGEGEFSASGTFGGSGQVKLQYLGPNAVPLDVGVDCTLTANGGGIFALGSGHIRVAIADATGVHAVAKGLG